MSEGQRIAILPDLQYPFIDWIQWRRFLCWLYDYNPTKIILIGDALDFPAVTTKYTVPPAEVGGTLGDIAGFKFQVLQDIRAHSDSRIYWTLGNHELRFQRYLRENAAEIASFSGLTYSKLFESGKYKLSITDDYFNIAPNTIATHSEIVRKKSGYTAWGNMERWGCSVVHGHSHRAALVFHTDHRRDIFGMEVGHMIDVEHMKKDLGWFKGTPDWQQAFGIIESKGQHVQPTLIKMAKDGFYVGGRRYK